LGGGEEPSLEDQLSAAEAKFKDEFSGDMAAGEQGDEGELEDAELKRWRLLVENGVGVRSAEGQKFARCPDGGKSAEYKALNQQEKSEFRKRWASQMYAVVKATKEKSSGYSKIDKSAGVYLPATVVFQREGGDRAALVAASNYISACIRMGGDWVHFNAMTRRSEYLYVQKEKIELFTQSWKMYEMAQKEKEADPKLGKGEADPKLGKGGADPKLGKGGADPKLGKGGEDPKGGKKGGEVPAPSPKPQPKDGEKSSFEKAISSGISTKKAYQSIISKATLVMENINSNEDWMWATSKHGPMLSAQLDSVKKCASSSFARKFLTMELKDVKAEFKQATLQTELEKFTKSVDGQLADMSKLVGKLLKMHQEAMKD
jgi:hypothetical protein